LASIRLLSASRSTTARSRSVSSISTPGASSPARTNQAEASTPASSSEEIAIPRSKASHYRLSLGSYYEHGVPWRNEAEELLDEILIERLPEEIAAPIAEAKARREAVQAEERRRERERDKDVRAFVKRAPQLTRDERQAEIQRLRCEYGFSALETAKGRELMELPEPHETLELAAAA